MKRTANRSPAQIEAERLRALELSSFGMTEREIAAKMTAEGMAISQPTVHRRVAEALEKFRIPEVEVARKAAIAQLDAYLAAMSDRLEAGDTKAIAEAVKIHDRKAKLLGLDAPKKTEVTVSRSDAELALAERIAQAQADLAAKRSMTILEPLSIENA